VEQLATDVKYSDTKNRDGAPLSLALDIFGPEGDNLEKRPLVLVLHGGSFIQGSRQDVEETANLLASLGYVTATVSYRIGIRITDIFLGLLDSVLAAEAVAMATQDLNTVIRWFRKGAAEDGNPYNIDPDLIFAVGFSAGAFMCNFSQYMNKEARIPDYIDMTKPGLVDGGLSSNNSGRDEYPFTLTAVATFAGAIYDTLWMEAHSTANAIFHAVDDEVVPYHHDVITIRGTPLLQLHGGYSMQLRAANTGMKHCWHEWKGNEGGGHIELTAEGERISANITRNLFGHYVCGVVLECDGNAPMPTELDPNIRPTQSMIHSRNRLKVFFNRKNHSFSLDLSGFTDQEAVVSMYDISGTRLHRETVDVGIYTIRPGQLSRGIYFVQVCDGLQKATVKWVIKGD
jgi:acetyl esterase/lipase